MRAFVIGAGVSKVVGYALGSELFEKIDNFIRCSSPVSAGFDSRTDWPELCEWLEGNENPLIREAYEKRRLEHLFTILDLAWTLRLESTGDIYRDVLHGSAGDGEKAKAKEKWKGFRCSTSPYAEHRSSLLTALELYFRWRHAEDRCASFEAAWSPMHAFARKLCPGDVVITFNYDSTVERALWQASGLRRMGMAMKSFFRSRFGTRLALN